MRDDPAVIAFLKCVEKHPCLWNFSFKGYNKKEITDLAWKEISSEVGDSEHNCRDRWKNIRCSFVRSQNNGKTKNRYYLADHLGFLLPYTKIRTEFDSQSVEYDDRREDESMDPLETTLYKFNEVKSEGSVARRSTSISDIDRCDSSVSSPSPGPAERERSSRKSRFMTRTTFNQNETESECSRCHGIRNSANDEDDTDLLFFKSMMPDIKKLSGKQKRVFKRKVMTLLEDILEN